VQRRAAYFGAHNDLVEETDMRMLSRLAIGACALAAMTLVVGTPAEARCSRASAMGFGVTQAMAMDFARMNLDAGIAAKGQKARGRVHYKCTGPLLSECRASRRACG
jgi:hypothetical protein